MHRIAGADVGGDGVGQLDFAACPGLDLLEIAQDRNSFSSGNACRSGRSTKVTSFLELDLVAAKEWGTILP
ncbi:hypothetical protein [Pontibaca methylaminivorans]|uniref:hypothetical protein n=1 Tax=Pontibaca methylaminivorans TaxID=515897 RepID=UPI0009788D62|nr:hypothetical protein [Pontibaca methylaminivorans]